MGLFFFSFSYLVEVLKYFLFLLLVSPFFLWLGYLRVLVLLRKDLAIVRLVVNNIRSEIGFKILNFKIVIAFSYLSVIA